MSAINDQQDQWRMQSQEERIWEMCVLQSGVHRSIYVVFDTCSLPAICRR
jgi:hypothetical protein